MHRLCADPPFSLSLLFACQAYMLSIDPCVINSLYPKAATDTVCGSLKGTVMQQHSIRSLATHHPAVQIPRPLHTVLSSLRVPAAASTKQMLHDLCAICRNPRMISGFCFVAPALPSTSSSRRTNRKSDSNSNHKDDSKKDSFIWRASFGQQLQRLYMRALLQNENAGVNYIRKSLQKRRDEVALGKLQVYADAGQQVQQVSSCLSAFTCSNHTLITCTCNCTSS